MPKIARPPEARREAQNRFSLAVAEGNYLANTLVLNFWHPELWDNQFLLFKSPTFWFSVMATLANQSIWKQRDMFYESIPDLICRTKVSQASLAVRGSQWSHQQHGLQSWVGPVRHGAGKRALRKPSVWSQNLAHLLAGASFAFNNEPQFPLGC